MYLGPHEFQAQAAYFESAIHFATSALCFACWGVTNCILDADALANGTVSLLSASGIFPDGTPFQIPQADALPVVREIAGAVPSNTGQPGNRVGDYGAKGIRAQLLSQ